MKLKNKLSLLTAIAALSLGGLGFAAWQFSKDAETTFDSNVSVVAKDPEVGTLAVDAGQTFSLVLDQNEDGGVYWADATGTKLSATKINVTYTGTDRVVAETIYFSIAMESNDADLATYVTFGDLDAEASKEYAGTAITYSYNLPTVSYTDAYPLNETEYDAMKSALDGAKVTFTLTAEVGECTHN